MAYRFTGASSSNVEFGIGPFNGYTFGALTMATLYKRASTADYNDLLFFANSAGSTERIAHAIATGASGSPRLEWNNGASGASGAGSIGTTNWYIVVVTCAGGAGNTIRFHSFDGTSWTHGNQSGGNSFATTAISSSDRLFASPPSSWGGNYINGDVVCQGVKKADSTDAQVESLSETSFAAWAAFGFDWLIGYENSSSLVNRANPGSGDEVARSGVTVVSDPAGWSWATTPTVEYVILETTGVVLLETTGGLLLETSAVEVADTGTATLSFTASATESLSSNTDTGTATLKFTPSATEAPIWVDSVTGAIRFTPSGTDTLLGPVGANRAWCEQEGYLEYTLPTSTTGPLYIEFDVEWTPDSMYPPNPSNTISPTMLELISDAGAITQYLAVLFFNRGWSDQVTMLDHMPINQPDGRGKHHVKLVVNSTPNYVWTIDGASWTSTPTFGTPAATKKIRFGWHYAYPPNDRPMGGLSFDNIKIGTTNGGTELANVNFNDGTYGSLAVTGAVTLIPESVPNEDSHVVYFNLQPSGEEPFSKRLCCRPADPSTDAAYVEHVFTTAQDEVHAGCEISWLHGSSWQWGRSPEFIQLLNAADEVIDTVFVWPDDQDWEWRTYRPGGYTETRFTDTAMRWPVTGRMKLSVHYDSGNSHWTIGDNDCGTHEADNTLSDLQVKSIRFGWCDADHGSDPGSTVFVDDIQVGTTAPDNVAIVDFEDGTTGSLTAVGEASVLETPAAPVGEFICLPASPGDEAYIWFGGLNERTEPVYIEFELEWTPSQQTAWGNWSGNFIQLFDRNLNWIEYIYHDPDGWWDNNDLEKSAPADDSGTHLIQMVHNAGVTNITIDGDDTGPHANPGPVDSLAFGWYAGGADVGGVTVRNIIVGTTPGGSDILGPDPRHPYEVFTVVGNVTFAAAPPNEDEAVVRFHLTPVTAAEKICRWYINLTGECHNKWQAGTFTGFQVMYAENHYAGSVMTENPQTDPC